MDKRSLSERDICSKFITPALHRAGWDEMTQIREEVGFTKGRIIVRGKLVSRGKGKRAEKLLTRFLHRAVAVDVHVQGRRGDTEALRRLLFTGVTRSHGAYLHA